MVSSNSTFMTWAWDSLQTLKKLSKGENISILGGMSYNCQFAFIRVY